MFLLSVSYGSHRIPLTYNQTTQTHNHEAELLVRNNYVVISQ